MTTDKTIKSKNQPKQTNVTWVDLSGETPVEKHFINGRWVAVSGGSKESDSEIFDEYVDVTDQQRNTALANVSNQTANSTTGKMGYKVLDPTKTFAEQVTAENTIYEIRDVFDLGGGSVTIPSGSTLKFNGGLLKNGNLNLNGCFINSNTTAFASDVTFSGTVSNTTIYTKWLSFVSANDEYVDGQRVENPTDNLLQFKQLQSLIADGRTIEFESNQYLQSSIKEPKLVTNTVVVEKQVILQIKDRKNVVINLNGSTIKALYSISVKHVIIRTINSDVTIKNGCLIGFAQGYDYPSYTDYDNVVKDHYEWHFGVAQAGGNLCLDNIEAKYFLGDGFYVGSGTVSSVYYKGSYYINNCYVHHTARNGISFTSSKKAILKNTKITDVGVDSNGLRNTAPKAAIDIEFEDLGSSRNSRDCCIEIDNIEISNCYQSITTYSGLEVQSFLCNNSYIKGILHVGNFSLGSVVFSNNVFKLTSNAIMNNLVKFVDCEFYIHANSDNHYLGGKYISCKISDYVLDEETYNCIDTRVHNVNGIFENCAIELHKFDFGGKKFYGCDINIIDSYYAYTNAAEFHKCKMTNTRFRYDLNTVVLIDGCDISSMYNGTSDVTGVNCNINNSKLSNSSMYYKAGSFVCNISNSKFEQFKATVISASELNLTNCHGGLNIYQTGKVSVYNSDLTILPRTYIPAFSICNIYAYNSTISDTTDTQPSITGYTGTVNAQNCIFNISNNFNTNSFSLKNCIVNSSNTNFTEAGFKGDYEKCIFSVPIATIGDMTSRPSFTADTHIGFQYFDTDLGKYICWNGTAWVNLDGTALS